MHILQKLKYIFKISKEQEKNIFLFNFSKIVTQLQMCLINDTKRKINKKNS
jgi:hypothetical protein